MACPSYEERRGCRVGRKVRVKGTGRHHQGRQVRPYEEQRKNRYLPPSNPTHSARKRRHRRPRALGLSHPSRMLSGDATAAVQRTLGKPIHCLDNAGRQGNLAGKAIFHSLFHVSHLLPPQMSGKRLLCNSRVEQARV